MAPDSAASANWEALASVTGGEANASAARAAQRRQVHRGRRSTAHPTLYLDPFVTPALSSLHIFYLHNCLTSIQPFARKSTSLALPNSLDI
jgi:hypothetical protein